MPAPKRVTWIVVADGERARFFVNRGPGKGLESLPDGEMAGPNEPSREIVTDRPGRSHERVGETRHAMEPGIDPHREEKARFVRRVAERLNSAAKAGAFEDLIVVAPPQALGDLRRCLDKNAAARTRHELGKDLTHVAPQELPRHLESMIRL